MNDMSLVIFHLLCGAVEGGGRGVGGGDVRMGLCMWFGCCCTI